MKTFHEWILSEGQREEIVNLQPNSVVTVFHGTDKDTAYDFCLNGIDAKKYKQYRLYPHISGGRALKFGLFIAPNLKTAEKFGVVVIKFKSLGKDLIYRFPVEMKRENGGFWKEKYPKSFRPAVSQDLLDTKGVEPQAIYIGLLSPRAIEKVFVYNYRDYKWYSMSREEYLESYKGKSHKGYFEPQEYNMDLRDFVSRIAKETNSTDEEIFNILKDVYKKHGYLTGIGDVPYSLLRRIERQLSRYV